MGAARADSGPPVPLQLENPFSHRRRYPLELLLSDLRTNHQVRTDHRVPQTLAALHQWQRLVDLGSAPGPPQPRHTAIHPRPERPFGDGVPASLRARVEPGGVHLGPLQAPRTAQRLCQESLGFERRGPPLIEANASPPSANYRILETGFFIRLIPLYYAGFSRPSPNLGGKYT